jgi:hypothetical protein
MSLTDEQIKAAVLQTTNDMLDHIYENGTGSEFVIRCMVKAGRAIESAATAPLLERIAELERELEALRKDADRYRWLKEYYSPQTDSRWMTDVDRGFLGEDLDAAIDAAKEQP